MPGKESECLESVRQGREKSQNKGTLWRCLVLSESSGEFTFSWNPSATMGRNSISFKFFLLIGRVRPVYSKTIIPLWSRCHILFDGIYAAPSLLSPLFCITLTKSLALNGKWEGSYFHLVAVDNWIKSFSSFGNEINDLRLPQARAILKMSLVNIK